MANWLAGWMFDGKANGSSSGICTVLLSSEASLLILRES